MSDLPKGKIVSSIERQDFHTENSEKEDSGGGIRPRGDRKIDTLELVEFIDKLVAEASEYFIQHELSNSGKLEAMGASAHFVTVAGEGSEQRTYFDDKYGLVTVVLPDKVEQPVFHHVMDCTLLHGKEIGFLPLEESLGLPSGLFGNLLILIYQPTSVDSLIRGLYDLRLYATRGMIQDYLMEVLEWLNEIIARMQAV